MRRRSARPSDRRHLITAPANAGFTLIETLIATAMMVSIVAALGTVTAQWLPNWNRGLARVQGAELLALGLERVVADLDAAEYVPPHRATRHPFFAGAELSVTFLRSTIGPNSPAGLEVVRIAEIADARGLALVRLHAPFRPLEPDQAFDARRLADPVVLVRAPYRVSFAYAGPDRVWWPTWIDAEQLPSFVRVILRNAATGRILSASTTASVHVNAPAECMRSRNPHDCGKREDKLPEGQKRL